MKLTVPFLDWRAGLENTEVDAIGNDVILFEKYFIRPSPDYPFKSDVTTAIICTKGTAEGTLNLQPFKVAAPCHIIILPGQILEYKNVSDDFSGLFIIISQRFTDGLMASIQERFPLFLSVRNNPVIPVDNEEILQGMVNYYKMLKRIVRMKDHPNRMDVVRHLTLAFFYSMGGYLHQPIENEKKSHREKMAEKFLDLVQANYKQERGLEFYADKLCLTPKHLSKVIRETTGKSANDWIDEHVILEAKALLKSTNMTIQQISDELNFPSQSFFGKYFKRVADVSPKEYKEK